MKKRAAADAKAIERLRRIVRNAEKTLAAMKTIAAEMENRMIRSMRYRRKRNKNGALA